MTCVCAEVSPRDYRAWYGLGQTYEILKMPYYCLYYYKRAQMLRFVGSAIISVLKLLLVAFRCLNGTFQRISIMLTNDVIATVGSCMLIVIIIIIIIMLFI